MTAVSREHGEDCGCARCAGFQSGNKLGRQFEPGNEVGVRHGAYSSPVRFEGRVAELAPQLAELVPAYTDADGPLVQLLALTLARIERAAAALVVVDEKAEAGGDLAAYAVEQASKLQRLRDDLRSWIGTAHRLLDSLAMTPASRGRLGLDIAQTKRVLGDLDALAVEGRRAREAAES